ncbi:LON peptidase substrate-binding domain-containing protein [Nocardiopsis alba]|uniref:LON peptidase substrate-binding domain-containing protein n=2 Tax=Nocardiopsis alba TaxID=53437 RepID=A0A7K2IXD7_9ACTN|nr:MULTISPECIES: LON peptidase substrate-binding domain-containing protein [Nocardiopsis]AFR09606.1 ATP-dependent protease La domain protein [Nocardiopsis alba ATCC BAA-2165]MEC3892146.1 LON peptidase substrate-binding domain-containing protein [Nocardiopsis sp. LDBS1602]MYR34484.1 peptidase S16 [Nocardiopsis alba]
MPEALPIFPLNTVLFPGMTIPLHVFEHRYRRLVSELLGPTLAGGEVGGRERGPVRFGTVWIELGHEVASESGQGAGGADTGVPGTAGGRGRPTLPLVSAVGCTAVVRDVRTYEDGRYDLVVEGGTRFRIDDLPEVDASSPDEYSSASVTLLPEAMGPDAEEHAERVRDLYEVYRGRLSEIGMAPETSRDLPRDPVALSHTVAASIVLDPAEKQRLLEAEDAATRLAVAARFLRRENRIVTAPTLPNLPAGPFLNNGVSFN